MHAFWMMKCFNQSERHSITSLSESCLHILQLNCWKSCLNILQSNCMCFNPTDATPSSSATQQTNSPNPSRLLRNTTVDTQMNTTIPNSSTGSLRGIGMNHSTWSPNNVSNTVLSPRIESSRKVIFFIRHGQAYHNLPPHDSSLTDPRLTSEGVRQSQRIIHHMPVDAMAHLSVVISSPLRRAIQTSVNAFGRLFEWRNLPLVLCPEFEENGLNPCDTGSSSSTLEDEFPGLQTEIRALPENWFRKTDDRVDVAVKRTQAINLLLARPESVIAVVTHNGFLRTLLGEEMWSKNGSAWRGFENGEIRRVVLSADGQFHHGDDSVGSGLVTMDSSFNDELEAIGSMD